MNANELAIFAARAARAVPYSLQTARFKTSEARDALKLYEDGEGDRGTIDNNVAAYLRAAVSAAEAVEAAVTEIVTARRIVREAHEAEMKAAPFRFVFNRSNGEQFKGGADSKRLCYDHVRSLLRDEPGATAFYTGRHGAAEPKRIRA